MKRPAYEFQLGVSALFPNKVYAGKMRPRKNGIRALIGIKHDVTQSFLDAAIRYFGDPENFDKYERIVDSDDGRQWRFTCQRKR